jgi:hypothetical protein
LAAHGVGRLGVASGGVVGIFTVNYALDVDNLIVRVRRGGELDRGSRHGAVVALQIDQADSLSHEGWSVLVRGQCEQVGDPSELVRLAQLPLVPWADEERSLYLRIPMETVTGVQIHHRMR